MHVIKDSAERSHVFVLTGLISSESFVSLDRYANIAAASFFFPLWLLCRDQECLTEYFYLINVLI